MFFCFITLESSISDSKTILYFSHLSGTCFHVLRLHDNLVLKKINKYLIPSEIEIHFFAFCLVLITHNNLIELSVFPPYLRMGNTTSTIVVHEFQVIIIPTPLLVPLLLKLDSVGGSACVFSFTPRIPIEWHDCVQIGLRANSNIWISPGNGKGRVSGGRGRICLA